MTSQYTGDECSTKTLGNCHQTLYWCSECESVLCQNCWDLQAVHGLGTGPRARLKKKKHEKTELAVANYVISVLDPGLTEEEVTESHVSNVHTRWFGVHIDENSSVQVSLKSKPFLELASGSGKDPSSQHPCLVSFVGETGAGKSTLINAMMKSVGATQLEDVTPVIGTKIDSPTSGDVHLFPDPKSLRTPRPLFFADCEGFGGGNRAPLAARAKESNKKFKLSYHPHRAKTRKRGILSSEICTRQWAVNELYPRILFTFSDIVCLVSKNFRMIENHIVDLLTWADNVFDKSLNQPMLPKAIIVVNGVESQKTTGDDWWDVEKVTGEQLESHRDRINLYCKPSDSGSTLHPTDGAIPQTPISQDIVAKLAHQWRTERKKTINSLRDLILCYYSDFKIICVPSANDPPRIIHQQYTKLSQVISTGAQETKSARKRAGLLMTSEDLDYYLEQGFQHFSTSKEPFNFLQAAVLAKPISVGFADHLLRTALTLLRQRPDDSGSQLLEKLAPIVASSIFLDVIRKRIPHKENSTHIFEGYREKCEIALRELYQKHWYCEERDQNGRRCVNRQNGHSKGHQDSKGRVFKSGEFKETYGLNSVDQAGFFGGKIISLLGAIFKDWGEILDSLGGANEDKQLEAALYLHIEQTSILHGRGGVDISRNSTSHTTCLWCRISTPLHQLFCGHVICQDCLECFAKKEQNTFELSICPLHNDYEWTPPWRVNLGPPTTGLRILSLDGGGVRSIVQLTILKELELSIGLGVNIVDFFDLIIGTSGGGIVAAGLGIRRFPIQECIRKFQQVSMQAFTKRAGVDSIIGPLIEAQHHSKYKTTNMVEALQKVFGEKAILFGGQRDPACGSATRVGVSATTSSGRAFLLANYQRPPATHSPGDRTGYHFYRGETAEEELKVWEALRATSAAPRYFKSFYHEASGHTFDDGAITYNNPAVLANAERKIIWPEQRERDPDILLSIGTLWSDKDRSDSESVDKVSSKGKFGLRRYAKKVFNIAANAIKDDLDCEKAWSSFYHSLNIAEEDRYRKNKYCRLNPKTLNVPPAMDSVSSIDELQAIAQQYCSTTPEVENVASTLIASLFYFELKGAKESNLLGHWMCEGEILCRLPANSDSLKKLCDRLLKPHGMSDNHQSWFYITNNNHKHRQLCKVPGSALKVYEEVSAGGQFCLPVAFKKWEKDASCRICVYLDRTGGDGFMISGFPRNPLTDKTWPLYRNFLADQEGGPGVGRMGSSHSLDHFIGSQNDTRQSDPDTPKTSDGKIDKELASGRALSL